MNAKRLVSSFLAALLMVLLTLPALAQGRFADNDVRFWLKLERQLVASLDLPMEQLRQDALKKMIYFSTYYPDKIDLSQDVGAVITVHKKDDVEANRVIALAALHAIGGMRATEYLDRNLTDAEFNKVRSVMASVLAEFNPEPVAETVTTR